MTKQRRQITGLLALLASTGTACSVEDASEPSVTSVARTTGEDPCLTEAADLQLSPIAGYLGAGGPTTWDWLDTGACSWFIAEYRTTGLQRPPLYVQTTAAAVIAGIDQATCTGLSMHERVYARPKPSVDWSYIGEASRGAVWSNGACELHLDYVSTQNVIPAGAGPLIVRILATGRVGIGIPHPAVFIDDAPLPES